MIISLITVSPLYVKNKLSLFRYNGKHFEDNFVKDKFVLQGVCSYDIWDS